MIGTKATTMLSSKHNMVMANISSKELYILALDIHTWGQPRSQLWMGKGLTEPPNTYAEPLAANRFWEEESTAFTCTPTGEPIRLQ